VLALVLLGSLASALPARAEPTQRAGLGLVVHATLAALPRVVQPGTEAADPGSGTSLVATFDPARRGQEVVLERLTTQGWRAVATARQDKWGSAAFIARRGSYRARTVDEGLTWTTGTVRTQRWRTSFEDTFSGSSLDTSVWNDQVREHEGTYGPRTCARVDGSARSVGDGVLRLGVAADPARPGQTCSWDWGSAAGTSAYYLNSQVATEHTVHVQHGIVAARMKLQRADGMHSALWLLPRGTTYVESDPSQGAEIDVMEFWGDKGTKRGTTIGSFVTYRGPKFVAHRYGSKFREARRALSRGRDWWDEFHVFSVEWTPSEYIFRVDGREYYREDRGVSQVPQYLVLSMQTADYELPDLDAADLDDHAEVDWIRVYDAASQLSARRTPGRTTR
jgi:beta-glucanase (GH16 family)